MIKLILKRILQGIPVIFGVITISFLLMYVAPGDPVLAMVGEYYDESTLSELRSELHLDDPLLQQYFRFIGNVCTGDFGRSYITGISVTENLLEKMPYTFQLAVTAMVIAVIFGIILGISSALYRNRLWDKIAILFSIGGVSAPVFWVALLLILIFGVELRLLPPSGYGSWQFIILPGIALGIRSLAMFTRITRTNFLEIMHEDYMTTAKAKGLSNFVVIFKHGLKNLLIPLITLIGLDFGSYLTGAVLTESIFGWPGVGRLMLDAIMKRDFPVIQGTVLFMVLVFVIINILVDIFYGIVNPQVREVLINEQS